MQIEWKSKTDNANYLFRQAATFSQGKVHRVVVKAGKMLEHETSFHEINVTISGSLVTTKSSATGKRICTKGGSGNLCLTPAGQTVSAAWNANMDSLGILLSPEFVKKTALENRFNRAFEFKEIYKAQDPLIQQIGLALLKEANAETAVGKVYSDSLIQTLTLHLLRNYSTANILSETSNGGLSGYKLKRVQEFINANLDEDLSLAEIAEIADLSQFHFVRAFRKSTGKTPQQYLMEQRIERAKELLLKDELPLVEISLQTGFKNQSHFTTLFRKFTKYTPKMWRETFII